MISPNIGSITFEYLKNICKVAFLLAGTIGGLLQLPFDAARWTVSLAPALVVPVLDYLPSRFSIQLVKLLLDLHTILNYLAQSILLTGVSVLLWRPMVEEIQYRYLLGNFLGKGKRKINKNIDGESEHMVHFIAVDGSDFAEPQITKVSDGAISQKEQSSLSSSPNQLSRRLLFSSIAYSLTRLGWLCAVPTTVDFAYPFLQTATSPYSWTVAFIQSAVAHFSSRMLVELSPFLQRSLLLLAVQQTVSTFLITWHVFVPLYLERGILASIGAHIAWTLGKMTWPIRLLWRAMNQLSIQENFPVLPASFRTFLKRNR